MKNRNELAEYLKLNNCKVGIEIGSYKGEYAKYLLDNWDGYLYLIDIWRKLPYEEYTDISNQENPKEIIGNVFDNLNGYEDRTILIRSNSHIVSNIFSDKFFDFIYIDANHKYSSVLSDLVEWYPKLKDGGIFAGHDWIADYDESKANENGDVHVWMYNIQNPEITEYAGLFGVNKAVKDFCKKININFNVTTGEYFGTWYFKKEL